MIITAMSEIFKERCHVTAMSYVAEASHLPAFADSSSARRSNSTGPGRQDLQFLGSVLSLLFSLTLPFKSSHVANVILPDNVSGILASTGESLASTHYLATTEHSIWLPPRNIDIKRLTAACNDLGYL